MASSRLSVELLSGMACLAAGFALGAWFEHAGVVSAAPQHPVPERPPPATESVSAAVAAAERVVAEAPRRPAADQRSDRAPETPLRTALAPAEEALGDPLPRREGEAQAGLEAALANELLAAALSGRLVEGLRGDPEALAELLFRAYAGSGDPDSALVLLRRCPGAFDVDHALALAEQFADQGQPALQAEALAVGLGFEPTDPQAAEALAALDPTRAVALLTVIASEVEGGEALQVRANLAQALARSGDADGALRLMSELMREGAIASIDLDLLLRLDPARAEEALAALRRALATSAGSSTLRAMYRRLDPEGAFQHLREQVRSGDAQALSELADLQAARGDAGGALESLALAVQREPGDTDWSRRLERSDPQRVVAEFEAALVSRPQDDELWGDLGDVHARAGRLGDALSCYRRARDIDPEDGEWTDKLEHPERASEE